MVRQGAVQQRWPSSFLSLPWSFCHASIGAAAANVAAEGCDSNLARIFIIISSFAAEMSGSGLFDTVVPEFCNIIGVYSLLLAGLRDFNS